MILLGRNPAGLFFGDFGVLPAQITTGGDFPSPLSNDVDPGDDNTEFLWVLIPPIPVNGTLTVTDQGAFSIVNPTEEATYNYRLFALPALGAPYVADSSVIAGIDQPDLHEVDVIDRIIETMRETATTTATTLSRLSGNLQLDDFSIGVGVPPEATGPLTDEESRQLYNWVETVADRLPLTLGQFLALKD